MKGDAKCTKWGGLGRLWVTHIVQNWQFSTGCKKISSLMLKLTKAQISNQKTVTVHC